MAHQDERWPTKMIARKQDNADLRASATARRQALARTKSYAPPLWSTEEYGAAHGSWEGEHHRVRTKLGWEVWAATWTAAQVLAWEEGLVKAVIERSDVSTDPKLVLRRLLEADPFTSERDVRMAPLREKTLRAELAATQKDTDAVRRSVTELVEGPPLDLEPEPEPEPGSEPSEPLDAEEAFLAKKKIQRRAAPGGMKAKRTTAQERAEAAARALEPEDLAKLRNRRRAAAERTVNTSRASGTQAVTSLTRSQETKEGAEKRATKLRKDALRASQEDKTEQFLFDSHQRVRQSQELGDDQPSLARRIAAMDAELAQCKVQWQRASDSAVTSADAKDAGRKKIKRHAEQIKRRKESLEQQLDRARLRDFDIRASVVMDDEVSEKGTLEKLMRALQGIDQLIADQARGATLTHDQEHKIQRRPKLQQELDSHLTKQYRPRPTVMVSVVQFVRRLTSVCKISNEQAQALFLKYGHDEHGRMPIPMFCTLVFTSDAHLRSMEGAHQGAFGGVPVVDPATGRQDTTLDVGGKSQWRWQGSFLRAPRFCRTGFFAPSHWEHTAEATCRASMEKPAASLRLEHIYGRAMSQDVFVTRDGEVVYYAAGVGIVYDPETHRQRFFREHTDDITCMCIHRSQRKQLGSGRSNSEQEMIATGQCATVERFTAADEPEKDRAKKVRSLKEALKDARVRRRGKIQLELDSKRMTEKALTQMAADVQAGADAEDGLRLSAADVRHAWEDLVSKPTPVNKTGKMVASKSEKALLPPVVYIWNPMTLGAPRSSNASGRAPGVTAPPARLQLPPEEGAVACLAFSADGEKLLTVSKDSNHTARLWNWRKDHLAPQDQKFHSNQCHARSIIGTPGMVFGCTWNPYVGEPHANPSSFITWGKKHLNVWDYNEEDATLSVPASDQNPVDVKCPGAVSCDGVPLNGALGKFRLKVMGDNTINVLRLDAYTGWERKLQFRVKVKPSMVQPGRSPRLAVAGSTNEMSKDVLTAAYLQSGHLVSGGPNGCITVYDGVKKEWLHETPRDSKGGVADSGARRAYRAMVEHQAHRPARKAARDDGFFAHAGTGWKEGGCTSLRVHPDYDDQLLSGGGDGTIRHWQVEYSPDRTDKWLTDKQVTLQQLRSIDLRSADNSGPPRLVLSVDWVTHDKRLHCMVADGENDIWMVPQERPGQSHLPELKLEGQAGDVYAVATHPTRPRYFATACEDGCIYLWNSGNRKVLLPSPFQIVRQKSEVRGLRPSDLSRKLPRWEAGEVLKGRSIAFSPDGRLLAVGSSGVIYGKDGSRVWGDQISKPAEGKTNMDNADRGGVLTVYALAPSIFPADSELEPDSEPADAEPAGLKEPELKVVFQAKIAPEAIAVIRFSPDGLLLAAGGHDNCIHLLDVSRTGSDGKSSIEITSRCKITKHSSSVSHLDWSQTPVPVDTSTTPPTTSYVLQSTSASYELLYFDCNGKQVKASMRDTSFATWSVPLGFPVMGMWRQGMDGTDINSCDTCHTSADVIHGGKQWVAQKDEPRSYLTFADDRGDVNLMYWPAVVKEAPCRRAAGHSSHVMAVRWTADNQRVISAGGRDQTTFQWQAIGIPPPPQAPALLNTVGALDSVAEGGEAAAQAAVMAEVVPVPAAVLRAQKLATDLNEIAQVRRSKAEGQAHLDGNGQLVTFTVSILAPPLSLDDESDPQPESTEGAAEGEAVAGTGVGQAQKQLVVGMILQGNHLPAFNGVYNTVPAAQLPLIQSDSAWPVLRNQDGRWCYRHVESQSWVLSAVYPPAAGNSACNASIVAKAGPLPVGEQSWKCWQGPASKKAIASVTRARSGGNGATEYCVLFEKDYAAIESRGDKFEITKDGPEGWLKLSDLEQREGGMEALKFFETARAKKAGRRAELAASALRKEEARVVKQLKEVEKKYGGAADETEEEWTARKAEEARAEWTKRQAERKVLLTQQLAVSHDAALASKEAELKELRASVRMLQRRVTDSEQQEDRGGAE